jgi:C1A family cysteine protease
MGNWYSRDLLSVPKRKYGWIKDTKDERDKFFLTENKLNETIKCVDLRNQCPPVYDQGNLCSCTANAIACAYEYAEMMEKGTRYQVGDVFTPSRLFIYYNERKIECTTNEDSGAQIRDGIKSINQQGVCPETAWPYDLTKFTQEPPEACYLDAQWNKSVKYQRIDQTLSDIKCALISGFPIVFGIIVYPSFETPLNGGNIPMPNALTETPLGGHAIVCVGFNDATSRFIFRNSWGATWGDQGYGYIPYEYLLDSSLASDFWVIQLIQDKD